MNNVTTGVK